MKPFNRRRCLSFIAGLLLLVGLNLQAGEPLIIAHRGASHDAPENTLAAFRLAWEQGADGIEGDFYLSQDNQIVCIHDKTTKRTADKDLSVKDATLAELRKLDAGSWKSPRFAGERIPTLAEVLAVVPQDKLIYVEIKCGPEIVPFLEPVFKNSGLSSKQIRIIAFDENVIAAVKKELPDIKTYWLTSYKQDKITKKWKPTPAEVLGTLKKYGADGLGTKAEPAIVNHKLADEFVKNLRAGGWEFHAWTIDEATLAHRLQGLGVDSITTNRPAFLREKLVRPTRKRGR